MSVKSPRLKQPLFSKEHGKLYNQAAADPILFHFIRAYDQIYNMTYAPEDMELNEILNNADINLNALGAALEKAFGEDIFEAEKTEQLSFDFEHGQE